MDTTPALTTKIRRRFAATLATSLAVGAAATLMAPSAHAWSGCEGDCVNDVKVTQTLADKAEAFLSFTTSVPANVKISVKELYGPVVATRSEPAGVRSSHTISTGAKLSQGKSYIVSITATDANGKSYTDQKGLTALSRTLTVTLKKIVITEDSDYGAGELAAGIKVGSTSATIFGRTSMSATKTLTYSKVFTGKNAPLSGKISVEINDDDADPGEFCSTGTGFSFTSGSNSCFDWTTGSTNVSVPTAPGTKSGSFSFSASGKLKFQVWGTYTVTVK